MESITTPPKKKSLESFDRVFSTILYLPIIKHFISRGEWIERLKITLSRTSTVTTNESFLTVHVISVCGVSHSSFPMLAVTTKDTTEQENPDCRSR